MKIVHSAKPKIGYNQLNNRARVFALFKLRISLRINFLKILLLNFVIIVTIVEGEKNWFGTVCTQKDPLLSFTTDDDP